MCVSVHCHIPLICHPFCLPLSHTRTYTNTQATDAGVLLVVKNYTGDRLNFGIAQEQVCLNMHVCVYVCVYVYVYVCVCVCMCIHSLLVSTCVSH
jgi:hypothetical protein